MKLIIDIPEDVYNKITEIYNSYEELHTRENLYQTIVSGKPYEERPQGKWINHPIKEFEEWDICTACGTGCRRRIYEDNALTVYNYPFCPNCGAEMNCNCNEQPAKWEEVQE